MSYIERVLGNCIDKHAKLEAAHSSIGRLQKEHDLSCKNHAASLVRVNHLESLELTGVERVEYCFELFRAALLERVDYLESLVNGREWTSAGTQHALLLGRVDDIERLVNTLDGAHSDVCRLQKEHESSGTYPARMHKRVDYFESFVHTC